MRLLKTILSLNLLLLPTFSSAAAWYGDLGLGFNLASDMKLDGVNDEGTTAKVKFDFGVPNASLAVGRYFGEHWRFEIEGFHRRNDLELLINNGPDSKPDAGDEIQVSGFSVNGIREFRIGALEPFLGAGLGPAEVRLQYSRAGNGGQPVYPVPVIEDNAWALGVQILAGFNVPLTPRWELAFDYRYWQASSVELKNLDGEAFDVKHRLHIGQAHVRYFFGDERKRTSSTLKPRTSGWYLTGSLGSGYAVDSDLRGTLDNLDAFKTGPLWSLALGYGLTPHWRLELEASERTNDVEVVDFSPINGQFPASGDVKASSLMVNAIYRFRPDHSIRPVLGVGAGAARVGYDVTTLGEVYLDETVSTPAAQIIAGFEIALTEQLDFTADYRSWYTNWLETEREGEKVKLTHWVHSVAFGLRFSF